MSDSREAFEQLHAIPSGAIWCENRDVYIHKNYSGLVLHPINESWEAFCEGALWQASRQEGEPIGYVVPRMLKAMQAGKYCGISISDEKKDGDIAVYTHPASAQAPEEIERDGINSTENLAYIDGYNDCAKEVRENARSNKQAVSVPDDRISVHEYTARIALQALEEYAENLSIVAGWDYEPLEHHYAQQAIEDIQDKLTEQEQDDE